MILWKYTDHLKKKKLDIAMINFLFEHMLEKDRKNYQEMEKERKLFRFVRKFASILTCLLIINCHVVSSDLSLFHDKRATKRVE